MVYDAEDMVEHDMPEKERFTVTDMASAEWCMEKIAEKRRKIQELNEAHDEMIDRYTRWWDKETGKLEEEIRHLESLLQPWAEKELEGQKKRSVNLPSGRVGFRKGMDTWSINGTLITNMHKEMTAWARKYCPACYNAKTIESVNWEKVKKGLKKGRDGYYYEPTGVLLPDGVTCTEGKDRFYAKEG